MDSELEVVSLWLELFGPPSPRPSRPALIEVAAAPIDVGLPVGDAVPQPPMGGLENRLERMHRLFYPHQFKIGRGGHMQCKIRKRYMKVCEKHNGNLPHCKKCKREKAEAEGGAALAWRQPNANPTIEEMQKNYPEHQFYLSDGFVMKVTSTQGYRVCRHNRRPTECEFCGGEALCERHQVKITNCNRCNNYLWCELHDERKYICSKCPGTGWCVKHNRERTVCFECDERKGCIACKKKHKQKDGYCVKCHPDYILNERKVSRFSCDVQDALERELGTPFQHAHFNAATQKLEGKEYCHEKWKLKPIDGAFMYEGELALFEAHGTFWHGHPSMHGADGLAMNTVTKKMHKDAFAKTERTMQKLVELTCMRLFYLWEYDYHRLPRGAAVWSIVREFTGKLEY